MRKERKEQKYREILRGSRGRLLRAGAMALLIPLASGCIKNDLPYPRIEQSILTLAASGETQPAVIEVETQSATVYLDEKVDLRNVRFTDFTYTEGASSSVNLLEGSYDMSEPLRLTLKRYQEYEWTVSAVQEIERYFTIDGQVGQTVIDVPGRRIVVRVPMEENLTDLRLTSIKLGPEGLTSLTPDVKPGRINLSKPLDIDVTAWGRTERWTVFAEKTEMIVNTSAVDAWSQVIWAYGEAQAGLEYGFEYREAGATEWTEVEKSKITPTGDATFRACITHLKPLTEYEVRAKAGEDYGKTITVTTQATEILPDGTFDQWWLDGKVWCPWDVSGQRFWDTGNKGATTVGPSNTAPSDYTPTGSGKSARLETVFASVLGLGKLASGSIFTGKYARTDGTNGILEFGRPWTVRPTKLKGYFQYQAKTIDLAPKGNEYEYLKGRPDSCHIYIAIADWTAPFEIRTNPKNRQLFDPNLPSIIAYGELVYSGNMDSYGEFEIPLVYRSTSREPKYIQITVSSSKYGDYFVGGTGSLLYVDQFSLEYDY